MTTPLRSSDRTLCLLLPLNLCSACKWRWAGEITATYYFISNVNRLFIGSVDQRLTLYFFFSGGARSLHQKDRGEFNYFRRQLLALWKCAQNPTIILSGHKKNKERMKSSTQVYFIVALTFYALLIMWKRWTSCTLNCPTVLSSVFFMNCGSCCIIKLHRPGTTANS